jgi:hypothetical protein
MRREPEPGGCGEFTSLYELATGRVIEVVDPQGRPVFAAGWLPGLSARASFGSLGGA